MQDNILLANKFARELTLNATRYEKHIYNALTKFYKNRVKILFQYPLHLEKNFFILDIFIPKIKLCIEIDGRHHKEIAKQKAKDKVRDSQLAEIGITTLRITNGVLENDSIEVINRIFKLIKTGLRSVKETNNHSKTEKRKSVREPELPKANHAESQQMM